MSRLPGFLSNVNNWLFQGGMHVLQLMDHYAAGFCVLIIAVVECVVINWIYKNEKFAANVKEMLGHKPARWWRICWQYISPLLLAAVLVYSLVDFTRAKYGSYEYPLWADGIGLCMTLASVLPIFVVAIYKLTRAPGSNIKEKWYAVTTPLIDSKDECVKSVTPNLTCRPINDIEDHAETEDEMKVQTHSLIENNSAEDTTKC
ncbi:hypothetical protein LSH36_1002g00015 [Paralvinella palmiformis]|uniref:Uncharacterized protein n=1 Tax=Paralvinella palmiformis TaxID=53620 RepID=A0AAD9MSB8_9ANNE|nr:hypothetical protein LSH36_1002g00015 [Paralvinella palmiformis]